MKREIEWESLKHLPSKELILGSAMTMIALMGAIDEIRTIGLLVPLATMSRRQLRRHFVRKAREKLRNMTEEEFIAFIAENFNSEDFED